MLKGKIRVLRAAFVVGLMGLAACGTGYREGAAATADPGSAAHRVAIVAIAAEMHASACKLGEASDRCEALFEELQPEVTLCVEVPGCEDALMEQFLDGESDEVAAWVALAGFEASMNKFVRDR